MAFTPLSLIQTFAAGRMFLARQHVMPLRHADTLCRIQANYEIERAAGRTFRRKNLGTWFGAGAAP
jgi:hypothetical protein